MTGIDPKSISTEKKTLINQNTYSKNLPLQILLHGNKGFLIEGNALVVFINDFKHFFLLLFVISDLLVIYEIALIANVRVNWDFLATFWVFAEFFASLTFFNFAFNHFINGRRSFKIRFRNFIRKKNQLIR